MIPWYSVTYSNGLEHVFISYKLIGVGIVSVLFIAFLIGYIVRWFK